MSESGDKGSARIEKLLTVFAGVFLIGGLFLEKVGVQLLFSHLSYLFAYLSGGYFGVVSAFGSLRNKEIDVDLLMILAALGAAYVGAPFEGGMLLFLFALSNVLQNHALDRSRNAIHSLMKLRPSVVQIRDDQGWVTEDVDAVEPGTVVRVRPGEGIALDGEVIRGESSIDESSITGEAIPVLKYVASIVYAGTVNQSGSLEYRVTRRSSDSTLSKIIRMVESAQSKRAKTQRFLEEAERHYALGVILLTVGLIIFPPFLGDISFSDNFYRAMTVMVVASPCALVISTPAAFLSAIGGAARLGVLFKGGIHLERLAEVDIVALDKTGTLTGGRPKVMQVHALSGEESELLRTAASIELHSEHPLARAIEEAADEENLEITEPCDFQSFPGKGAKGKVGDRMFIVGNSPLLHEHGIDWNGEVDEHIEAALSKAYTIVLVGELTSVGGSLMGFISITDQIRPEARDAVEQLKTIGVKEVVMLTGDNSQVAEVIRGQSGVDQVYAGLLPEDKVRIVEELSMRGRVAMVGDGVNDAPALAVSHVGIAMGAAGTDVAMKTADVVLMSSNLHHLDHAIGLARASRRIVKQNLAFALGVIVVLVICALTIGIPLPLGVVGHEGSTVLVCLNGLRLLRFRNHQQQH